MNIVEQGISALKAAIKTDISRPDVQVQMNNGEEARRQGIPLGHYQTQLLLQALQRNVGAVTPAKCGHGEATFGTSFLDDHHFSLFCDSDACQTSS